jgi:hypothetical protein
MMGEMRMADIFMHYLSEAVSEVLTILIGTLISFLAVKAHKVLDTVKKKDQLHIIDVITDRAVEYAEAELTGEEGKKKRDFAIDKAIEILASKGIVVSRDEIIAGIENGVNKLKQK